MAEAIGVSESAASRRAAEAWNEPLAYDRWARSIGIPIYRDYFIPDAKTVELARWDERECDAAFLQLVGNEGVAETRVTEIAPGKTLPPLTFGFDEMVYVLEGRGLTTLWREGGARTTFEWQKHSLFLIPRHWTHQLSNTQGGSPARLLHCNYLPLALGSVGDPDLFLNVKMPVSAADGNGASLYSEATAIEQPGAGGPKGGVFWYGNFFPSLSAWDKLTPFRGRGSGGHVIWIRFPESPITCHMSVFPAQTYKKAHRHGPGFVIVIPGGAGYSVLWPEGQDKIMVPWQEGTVFVPPYRWFHQHFNLGAQPARYLALHPPRGLPGYSEAIDEPMRDQIEYPDEEPSVRARFEAEIAKRGLSSRMPEEAYRDANYEWAYGDGD